MGIFLLRTVEIVKSLGFEKFRKFGKGVGHDSRIVSNGMGNRK